MSRDTDEAAKLKPFIMRWINDSIAGLSVSGGGVVPSPHDLSSIYHSGTLADSQAPQFAMLDGSRTFTGSIIIGGGLTVDGVDVSAFYTSFGLHVGDPNAHHLKFVALADSDGVNAIPDASGVIAFPYGFGTSVTADGNTLTFTISPATNTVSTINDAVIGGSHTHAITASFNPGAATALLKTDTDGSLLIGTTGLVYLGSTGRVGIGVSPSFGRFHLRSALSTLDNPALYAEITGTGSSSVFDLRGFTANALLQARVSGDANSRIQVFMSSISMGPATTTPDVRLQRSAASTWLMDGGSGGSAVDLAVSRKITAGNSTVQAAFLNSFGTTEQLRLLYDASNYASFTVGGGGNLTVAPTGDLIFDPIGNDILPQTGYDLNLGSITKKYLQLFAAELWVETLVAQDTVATIGGRVLIGPTTQLTADITSGATTILVKHNQMQPNDTVYLESNGQVEFMLVTAGPTGSGPYSYTVTRDRDGTGANAWNAGDAVFNTGVAGSGFIDLYSLQGVNGKLLDAIYNYDNGAVASPYEAGTYSVNYATANTISLFGDGAANQVGDSVYYGNVGGIWSNLYIILSTAMATSAGTLVWEFWNGSAWTSFVPTVTGALTATGAYAAEWTASALTAWAAKTINGFSAYWVRNRWSTTPTVTVVPIHSGRRVFSRSRVYGPTVALNVRNSTTFNDWSTHAALGNLNGLYDYGADTYGVAVGKYAVGSSWLSADPTNGVRIMNYTTAKGQWFADGSLMIGSSAAGKGNLYIDNTGNLYLRTATVNKISFDTSGNGLIEGVLGFGSAGGLFHGSGTFASPTSALKIYQTSSVGLWESWNGSVKQVYTATDGKLYAGAGAIAFDATGAHFSPTNTTPSGVRWENAAFGSGAIALDINAYLDSTTSYGYVVNGLNWTGNNARYGQLMLRATGRAATGGSGDQRNIYIYLGAGTDPGGQYTDGIFFVSFSNSVTTKWGAITSQGFLPGNQATYFLNYTSSPAGLYTNGSFLLYGNLYVGNQAARYFHDDGTYTRFAGNFVVDGDLYFNANWASNWMNQLLKTTDNVTFNRITISNYSIFGNTGVDYLPTSGNWSSGGTTLYVQGNDYSSIGFHDAGNRVDFIVGGGGILRLGYDGGWGAAVCTVPGGMRVSATGVYIGSTGTAASYLIHLSADSAGKPSGGSWANSSDRRLKIVHGPYTRGLRELRQLNPILFEFNGKNNMPRDGIHASFIAQDVELVTPEMVGAIKGEIDGVDTMIKQLNLSDLPLMLRNGVIALEDRVIDQDKRIEELERLVHDLLETR